MTKLHDPREILQLTADEPWPEPVDGAALLANIADRIKAHVVLPAHAPETLSLWVLHTYAFELRNISTYISIESPDKRCGKTTLLSLLAKMVARPVIAANISSSAIFRVIEEVRPTLLIDEADTFLSSNDEMRGILNAGYERDSAYVVRVGLLGDSRHASSRLRRFSCWCPKVIASIGSLPATLSDRCITMKMHRKTSAETLQRLRDYVDGGLRSQCLRFVQDHEPAIRANKPVIPDSLGDRAADVWEPLFVLADIAGGAWPVLSREASGVCRAAADQSSPISSLLCDIFLAFHTQRAQRLFTREIIEELHQFGDRPYAPQAGKSITATWLSRTLSRYGVHARPLWKGQTLGRGYESQDFHELFRRYMSKAEVQAYLDHSKKLIAEQKAHPPEETGDEPLGAKDFLNIAKNIQHILSRAKLPR